MALKRKKNIQRSKKLIVRRKVIQQELTADEVKEQAKKREANRIIPRIPDTFYCENPVYPKHILENSYESLTDYEQKLYFEEDGILRPTTELGHPRNRYLKRYAHMLNDSEKKKAQTHNNFSAGAQAGAPVPGEKLRQPDSRKRSFSLTSILKALMQKPSKHSADKTVARVLMEVMLDRAQKGDFAFMREIFNRVEGKVPDQLNMQNPAQAAREAQQALEAIQALMKSGAV